MTNPDGYTALDLVGYTDKGDYSANATYVANDLVHYGGSIWCCLIDDTTGITPTEGANWRFWVKNSQNGISDIVNVLGAKNLLKIETNSATSNSVRLTVNDDGSLTINGTATPSAAYFILMNHDFGNYRFATDGRTDANAQYILSGLPTDPYLYMAYDASNKRVTLVLLPGHTADNVTFYPMIRPSGIEDATWQPYAKTNKELTAEVAQNTSDIQTLTNQTAKKTDLINVIVTGTTNNTGSNISANRYFYLNEVLVKAKVDIPNGATFTLDTNYEVAYPLLDLGTIIKNTSAVSVQGWTTASIPSGTETEITSRQLDSNGVYLISFFNAYNNSFTQNAYLMIKWGNDSAKERVMNVGTGYVGGALSVFAIVTGSSLVHFNVRQDSGSTQTGTGSLKIVRLY